MTEPAASDDELKDSLRDVLHRRALDAGMEPGLMLTSWVVIAAAKGFAPDGAPVTQVLIMPDAPEHELLGLIDHAHIRVQAGILEGYMDGMEGGS